MASSVNGLARMRHRRMLLGLVLIGAFLAPMLVPAAAPAAEPQTTAPGGALQPGSQYRYIWVGRGAGDPKSLNGTGRFTQTDLDTLNQNDRLVIIDKFHAGWDFGLQDQDANLLASGSNHPKVIANFLGDYVADNMVQQWGDFNPAWYLRDANGRPIQHFGGPNATVPDGTYVDLSNEAYRDYIVNKVVSRLANAGGWAGVMYDVFHRITGPFWTTTENADGSIQRVRTTLSTETVQNFNDGLPLLLQQTKTALANLGVLNSVGLTPGHGPTNYILLFNGVASQKRQGIDFVPDSDGAQDEFYCYNEKNAAGKEFRPASRVWTDIQKYLLLAKATKKTMLHSVKLLLQKSRPDEARIERLCFGEFLMEYTPGYSYIQFKWYPSETAGPQIELDRSYEEQTNTLGAPNGAPKLQANTDGATDGNVFSRTFQGGCVVVNAGTAPESVQPPCQSRAVTIPADDAWFSPPTS